MTRSHLKKTLITTIVIPARLRLKLSGVTSVFEIGSSFSSAFAFLLAPKFFLRGRETILLSLRHTILLSLFVLIICESSLLAQNKYDLSQFGHETSDFIKQPTKWDGGDWLKLGVMSAGSFLLIKFADQPARDLAFKDRSYLYSVPIEGGRIWGELYSPIVLFAGFAAHSLIANNHSTRKIAYEIGQASLYTGAITYILKSSFGRARPYMNEGTSSYHPFTFDDDYHSFPGGHTATAFVLSTVLSRNAGATWLKILAYLPAAITPFSRVYEDKHWVSSNFFGGTLGYFVAKWVVDIHEKQDKQDPSTSSTQLFNISFVIN
jgi:membrane-associated phospholipid phosphatase